MRSLSQSIMLLAVGGLANPCLCLTQNAVEDEALRRTQQAVIQAQQKAQLAQQKAQTTIKHAQSELRLHLAKVLGRSDEGRVLLVPTAQTKPEQLANIVEDMTVMSRIFDKSLTQERLKDPAEVTFLGDYRGMRRLYTSRTGATASLYIQDYGALFMIGVDFPLSPGLQVQEEPTAGHVDQLWRETQREIYAPEHAVRREKEHPAEKYDAKKVEDLKQTLINTLKHAANIRTLKPDESVIVTVGTGSQPGSHLSLYYLYQDMPGAGRLAIGQERCFPNHSILIIRASKESIDSFSKGEMDFAEFRERVQLFTY